MQTYITILRGINVSGQKKIEMSGLKVMFEQLSLEQVTTYIQSGNIIFREKGNQPEEELVKAIQQSITAKFGFHVPVILRTLRQMKEVAGNNPWVKEPGIDPEKLHVTFLTHVPPEALIKNIMTASYLPDQFRLSGREIYLYCPGGYGNTKLNNNYFENKLKVTATTRNWRTVNKLIELGEKIQSE
jgi:uncharacterized protein (DUF1697 family)